MKEKSLTLKEVTAWLDKTLRVASFSDVSNNGLQIARTGTEVSRVAFAVDASLASVRAAAAAHAQLLVVHHGISWGGGMTRLTGGLYAVVRAAVAADLALYGVHLPLDAHPRLGNNAGLARFLGLRRTRPAFTYHGNVIGLIGTVSAVRLNQALASWSRDPLGSPAVPAQAPLPDSSRTLTVGICSGGGGAFAPEAKESGCDLFVTGEADWGETIAAENAGIPIFCLGHYATETFGVRALAKALTRDLGIAALNV